jgi:pimeloyl-ACP methyl ester carboxylesterase
MATVLSRDGTSIAYSQAGSGPPLIIVDGALCHRAFGPSGPLARSLSGQFTVITYDRRGRGESGSTPPYAVEREVEDIEALIDAAGAPAFVLGVSSGVALALEAANRGLAIRKLALYEAPFIVDRTREPLEADYLPRLKQMIAEDRRSDAVKHFMSAVQVPRIFVFVMSLMPSWNALKAVAPTLVHDITIVEAHQRGRPLPYGRWAAVAVPALVMDGGKSPVWMRNAQRALAAALPNATARTLPGQTHMVKPAVLAAAAVEFFAGVERQPVQIAEPRRESCAG